MGEHPDHHRVRLTVAADSRWFEGHFPGEPILPAVAQLGLLQGLRLPGPPALLTGVRQLRLTAPVLPGDALEVVRGLPGEDGSGRMEVRTWDPSTGAEGGGRRSEGVVQWQAGVPAPVRWDPAPYPEAEGSIDPGLPDRLPHAGPARLARAVLERNADGLLCRGRVPADHPSADPWPSPEGGGEAADPGPPEGHAPTWMGLELAAQAAGLLEVANREAANREGAGGDDGEPSIGYLVRVRDALFAHPFLPLEAPLLARVRRTGGAGPLALYDFVVELERAAGEAPVELLRGSLGTFVPAQ